MINWTRRVILLNIRRFKKQMIDRSISRGKTDSTKHLIALNDDELAIFIKEFIEKHYYSPNFRFCIIRDSMKEETLSEFFIVRTSGDVYGYTISDMITRLEFNMLNKTMELFDVLYNVKTKCYFAKFYIVDENINPNTRQILNVLGI